MIKDCLTKVEALIEERSLDVPKWKIKELAKAMESWITENPNANDPQYMAAMQEIVGKYFTEAAAIKKMAAYQNMQTKVKMLNTAKSAHTVNLGKPEVSMATAIYGGAVKVSEGGRLADPDGAYKTYADRFYEIFSSGADENVKKWMTSYVDNKDILDDFMHAKNLIEKKLPIPDDLNPNAVKAAKLMQAMQNQIVIDSKAIDPYFQPLEEYGLKGVHDQEKVMAVSEDEFLLDYTRYYADKSFADENLSPSEFANRLLKIRKKIENETFGSQSDSDYYPKRESNKRRALDRRRVLIPGDWKLQAEQIKKYGPDSLENMVYDYAKRKARQLAGIHKYGNRLEENIEWVKNKFRDGLSEKEQKRLDAKQYVIDNAINTITGKYNTPATTGLGKGFQTVISTVGNSRLGLSLMSSWMDIPNVVSMAQSKTDGVNINGQTWKFVSEYMNLFTNPKDKIKAARALGMSASYGLREYLDRIGGMAPGTGRIAKFVEKTGPMNLLKHGSETTDLLAGAMWSQILVDYAELPHAELPEYFKDTLKEYSISPGEWDHGIRKAIESWAVVGEGMSKEELPDFLRDVKQLNARTVYALRDEVIENMVRKTGMYPEGYKKVLGTNDGSVKSKLAKSHLDFVKSDLSIKVGSLMSDFALAGSTTPNTRQKAILYRGRNIDDPIGGLVRLLAQFKGSALAQLHNYQRMYYSGGGLRSSWMGYGIIAARAMTFAAMTEWAKEIVRGQNPSDWNDPEFMKKVVASAGLGAIVLDPLLNALDDNGISDKKLRILSYLAGPGITDIATAGAIGAQTLKAPFTKEKVPFGQAFRLGVRQLPLNNIIGLEGPLKYFIYNGISEHLNPGYNQKVQELHKNGYYMMSPTSSWRLLGR